MPGVDAGKELTTSTLYHRRKELAMLSSVKAPCGGLAALPCWPLAAACPSGSRLGAPRRGPRDERARGLAWNASERRANRSNRWLALAVTRQPRGEAIGLTAVPTVRTEAK
jgi:hypothetical protein